MTKLKNTKKGMAKKALSISLVAAMLATSNVPVWAAEDLFSDGSAAVEAPSAEVDTFSAAPVEEVPTDVPQLQADVAKTVTLDTAPTVYGDVTATFGGFYIGAGEGDKYAVNWYVSDDKITPSAGDDASTLSAYTLVGSQSKFATETYSVLFSDRGNGGSTKVDLNTSQIGKYLTAVVFEDAGAGWKILTSSTSAQIEAGAASEYCTLTQKDLKWGLPLNSSDYLDNVKDGATASDFKWSYDGVNSEEDGYTTGSADVNKIYTLDAKITVNGVDLGRAPLAKVKITAKDSTDVDVKYVEWEAGVETDSDYNPVYTYDGTAHYPKIVSITLDDGTKILAKDAQVSYVNGSGQAHSVAEVTNANETGVAYKAIFTTTNYGEITVDKNLIINRVDLSKTGTLTVTKGFEYNKNNSYVVNDSDDAREAGLSVTSDGKTLTIGTGDKDYKVSVLASPNAAGAGNANVTIEGTGNYKGILTVKAPITAKELKEDNVSFVVNGAEVAQPEYPYNGNAVEPTMKVTIDGTTLVKDTDYTVSYSNNKEVGTATVTVTGKGNYTGTINKTFKITAADLDELLELVKDDFTDPSKLTYTGKPIDLVKDAYADLKYVKNRDFTVEYEPQNTNAGKVMLKLHGINNYAGAETEEFEFTILPRNLNDKDVKVSIEGLTYDTNLTDTQIKKAITITYNGMTLVENTDYKATIIKREKNEVTLQLLAVDNGNYTGLRTVTVSMTEKDINTVTLPKIDAQKYTGSEYRLSYDGKKLESTSSDGDGVTESTDFAIKDGDYTLEYGKDYKVVNYENNKNVGTATINIVGMGAYKGTASISFPIVDQKLTGSIVLNGSPIIPDQEYSYDKVSKYGGYTFTFGDNKNSTTDLCVVDQNGSVIKKDKYTVTYKDNTAAGTATITVEGKDGYDLYAVNTFKIVPAKITNSAVVSIEEFGFTKDEDHYYTGEEIKPSMDVDLRDGDYKLVEGTDYELVYSDNVNVGTNTAKVKVVGLGNYSGSVTDAELVSLTKQFSINKTKIRPTDVVAADVAYAGGLPVEPQITVTNRYSGKALVKDTDYTVEITKGGNEIGQVTAKIKLTNSAKKNYGFTGNSVDGDDTTYDVNFNVKAQDLANVEISEIADQVATGEQIKPAIVVMNGKARMVEGYDYEVTYGENKEVGTGTVKITPVEGNKNYVGSKEVTFNIVEEAPEVGKAVISEVKVAGNTVTPVLSEEVAGAVGYDYVLATEEDYTNGRVQISKNVLTTNTNFYYVEEGTYYVYCHAWKRDENGVKVFGEWSNLAEVTVTATTPETPSITKVEKSSNGKHLRITWTKSENATGYDVVMGQALRKVNGEYRPVDYGTAVKKVTNGNTVSVIFYNIPKGTYYVGLHAYNRTSETGTKVFSKWSNSKKVTF